MNENDATPMSIAAMPARRSCLMPNMMRHQRAAAGNSPASPMARSMNTRFASVERPTQGMPRCASSATRPRAARQQAIEDVDGAAHEIVLAAPPAFVTPQEALRARVFARREASAITSASAAASSSPRFAPCPASGCTTCAASPTSATRAVT